MTIERQQQGQTLPQHSSYSDDNNGNTVGAAESFRRDDIVSRAGLCISLLTWASIVVAPSLYTTTSSSASAAEEVSSPLLRGDASSSVLATAAVPLSVQTILQSKEGAINDNDVGELAPHHTLHYERLPSVVTLN